MSNFLFFRIKVDVNLGKLCLWGAVRSQNEELAGSWFVTFSTNLREKLMKRSNLLKLLAVHAFLVLQKSSWVWEIQKVKHSCICSLLFNWWTLCTGVHGCCTGNMNIHIYINSANCIVSTECSTLLSTDSYLLKVRRSSFFCCSHGLYRFGRCMYQYYIVRSYTVSSPVWAAW